MSSSQINSTPLFERLGGRPNLIRLLHHFYADVRQHQVIGPIFTAHIHDWPKHIEKIADFWSNATGGPVRYAGGMPMKHIPLGLEEKHFQAWLGLWEHNCRVWLSAECAQEMVQVAQNIGMRLRMFCHVPLPQSGAAGLDLSAPPSNA
jgi:hemoglobin